MCFMLSLHAFAYNWLPMSVTRSWSRSCTQSWCSRGSVRSPGYDTQKIQPHIMFSSFKGIFLTFVCVFSQSLATCWTPPRPAMISWLLEPTTVKQSGNLTFGLCRLWSWITVRPQSRAVCLCVGLNEHHGVSVRVWVCLCMRVGGGLNKEKQVNVLKSYEC